MEKILLFLMILSKSISLFPQMESPSAYYKRQRAGSFYYIPAQNFTYGPSSQDLKSVADQLSWLNSLKYLYLSNNKGLGFGVLLTITPALYNRAATNSSKIEELSRSLKSFKSIASIGNLESQKIYPILLEQSRICEAIKGAALVGCTYNKEGIHIYHDEEENPHKIRDFILSNCPYKDDLDIEFKPLANGLLKIIKVKNWRFILVIPR